MTSLLIEPAARPVAAPQENLRNVWSTGDLTMAGAGVALVQELLCESVDLHAGERVLDVATGSGTAAIAAARRGCIVTGVDLAPGLLSRARERAASERLDIQFDQAGAEALPYRDEAFDVTLSSFGVMFAPDPDRAAAELGRVTRPGGRLGLASWTPTGLLGAILRISARFLPSSSGSFSPVLWGHEPAVTERLSPYFAAIRRERNFFTFRASSPQAWLNFVRIFYGPVQVAFDTLEGVQREVYMEALLDVLHDFNRSGDGSFYAPAEYLEVTAIRRKKF